MIKDTDEVLPLGTDVRARYRTLAIVGRGGVGTVYRVQDLHSGGTFALKELANPTSSARKQFENEAQWLYALDHPNIPKVRAYFEWGPRVYLVMDFVEGENLEQKLARGGGRPLPEEQVLAWTLPICDALQYLHAQVPPILHRDVKPANIIVTPAGYPVLVDLGIAKEHLPGAGQTATFVKKAGTEGYAPPEQYTSAGKTGPWSDVYGMGATLYELLTGTLPPTAVERVALDSHLQHPRAINHALSVAVDEAVMRALELRPADRFQSMVDLARALGATARASAPGLASIPRPAPGGASGSAYPAYPSMPMSPPTGPSAPSAASGPYAGLGGLPDSMSPGSSPGVASLPSLNAPQLSVPSPIPPARTTSNPGMSYPSRGAVLPPLEHDAPASNGRRARATTKPVEPAEPGERSEGTRRFSMSWLVGIVGGLALLAIAIGAFAVFTLGPLAPPDRSSPQATTNGYFSALAVHDYSRAWQYLADSRNATTLQASDIASLQADDQRYGQVQSAHISSLQQGPVGSAQAAVAVQRGAGSSTSLNYSLVLTLYDGQTWLISSVSSS